VLAYGSSSVLAVLIEVLALAENYRQLTAAFSFSVGVQGVFLRGRITSGSVEFSLLHFCSYLPAAKGQR
jgi:hypothetical protein